MMAEGHRLGRLQVGEARHDRVGMLRPCRKGLISLVSAASVRPSSLDPEAEIERHLVVARACGVQPPGGSPISSASRDSMFMWMSSSWREKAKAAFFDL
jgi:hypothetical protein